MSREWYIRTDTRHVQDTFGEIDTAPVSAGEKWRKNRKKYILWIIEAVAVVALLVVVLPDLLRPAAADYTLTVVTENALSAEQQNALQNAFSACGKDLDGDGQVRITLRLLTVGQTDEDQLHKQMLINSFYDDRYLLFAMQPACYERYVAAYTAEKTSLFETLEEKDGYLFGIRTMENRPQDWESHQEILQNFLQNDKK